MNIFSGGRRLAFVFGILISCLAIAAIFQNEPRVPLFYEVPDFAAKAKKVGECRKNHATRFTVGTTGTGTPYQLTFCFVPALWKEGIAYIPYKYSDDAKYVDLKPAADPDVYAYMRGYEDLFEIPSADLPAIDREYAGLRWKQVAAGIGWLLLGAVVYWGAIFTIGWVARGFAGIPRGRDSRPS
jgi:hypothetical protein